MIVLFCFGRLTPFKDGLSIFLKKESQQASSSGHSSGIISGGLEAWKLISMLIQMMFSIGVNGDVVPNTNKDLRELGVNSPLLTNMSDVIHSACASCFELHMALNSKRMHYTDFEKMMDLVSVAKYHNLRLAVLMKTCFKLREIQRKHTLDKDYIAGLWRTAQAGNKHHYLGHFLISKLRMGSNITIVDTELSEKSHRVFVKIPYSKCSKRFGSRTMEIAQLNKRKNCIALMRLVLTEEFLVEDQVKRVIPEEELPDESDNDEDEVQVNRLMPDETTPADIEGEGEGEGEGPIPMQTTGENAKPAQQVDAEFKKFRSAR